MKKSLLLLVFAISLLCNQFSQAQEFQYNWTEAQGSNHQISYTATCYSGGSYWYSYACPGTANPSFLLNDIEEDTAGNTFQFGTFNREFDIDSGEGTFILTPSPSVFYDYYGYQVNSFANDYFISKRKSNSQLLWAGSLNRSQVGTVEVRDIETTPSGDLIVLGNYSGTINFALTGPETTYSAISQMDFFIAKYDGQTGGLIWQKTISGVGQEYAQEVETDDAGNIIITGRTLSSTFYPNPESVTSVTPENSNGAFIGKYDQNGSYLWSVMRSYYSTFFVDVDDLGNVYELSYYNGTSDLDGTANVANFTANGSASFITKYSPAGAYLWTREFKRDGGESNSSNPFDFQIRNNLLYIALNVSPSYPTDVNPSPSAQTLLSSGYQAFIKWDANGNYVSHFEPTPGPSYSKISVSPDDKLAIAVAYYSSSSDLNPGAGTATLTGANKAWIQLNASMAFETAFGLNFNGNFDRFYYDSNGRLYIGGSNVNGNSANLNSANLTENSFAGENVGIYNYFITRYGPPCDPADIDAPTGAANQAFCDSATVADLQATGTEVLWYEEETGGTALASTAALSTGTYFASQTIDCEGSNRLLVNVSINNTAAPTGDAAQNICDAGTLADLDVTGTNIQWYADADSETVLPSDTALVNGATYYASQTASDCESLLRLAVTATIDTLQVYYADADGDGFGNASVSVQDCNQPENYVTNNTDCDDQNIDAHESFMFYPDTDLDTYGTGELVSVCAIDAATPPSGYSLNNTDCDDADQAVFQSAELFIDVDGDGYTNGSETVCYGDTIPSGFVQSTAGEDCDDQASGVNPGMTEIGYNLIDDNCDGSIDEGFPAKISTVAATTCSTILPEIDTTIYSTLVAGAQGYQWKVTTVSGPNPGQIQILDTPLRAMRLTQLPNYAFAATYKIEVAVRYAGFVQPFTASTCTVSTPATTTRLTQCGATLSRFSDVIYANAVPFATGYKFQITDPVNPANTQEIIRPLREFRLANVTAFEVLYGKTYIVRVAIRNTDGTYLPYGQACGLTTSPFPTTSVGNAQCDNGFGLPYQVPSMNTPIYATSYPGVLAYVFRLTGLGLPATGIEVTKSLRTFTLNDFAGMGLIPGYSYNVNVRLIFEEGAPLGSYGKTCTLTVPGGARIKEVAFDAIAHPNPFAESFGIELMSSSNNDISVNVYDMTGRILETRNVSTSEMTSATFGDRYPAGVYNIVIQQNDNVKTLRIIKR